MDRGKVGIGLWTGRHGPRWSARSLWPSPLKGAGRIIMKLLLSSSWSPEGLFRRLYLRNRLLITNMHVHDDDWWWYLIIFHHEWKEQQAGRKLDFRYLPLRLIEDISEYGGLAGDGSDLQYLQYLRKSRWTGWTGRTGWQGGNMVLLHRNVSLILGR